MKPNVTVTLKKVDGHSHPQKLLAIEDGRLVPWMDKPVERRQDCEPAYRIVKVDIARDPE